MTIAGIVRILQADLVCGADHLETEVHNACGSDMMSDVLAFVKDQSVLLTGLVNPQVVRTADMMDMVCIVFVRGKDPTPRYDRAGGRPRHRPAQVPHADVHRLRAAV